MFLSNPGVRPEDIERLRRSLGLDRPLWLQYVRWLGAFLRGDWGYSMTDSRPVLTRILERAPATLELAVASMLLASLLTMIFGTHRGAAREGEWLDRAVRAGSAVGLAASRVLVRTACCSSSSPPGLAGCPPLAV